MDINPVRQESLRQQKEADSMTTKQTAQHTSGPWSQKDSTKIYAEGREVADCVSHFASSPKQHIGLEDEANAEFICRACNSHDGLVAALQDLYAAGENQRSISSKAYVGKCYHQARTMLAAATGEK